MPNLEKLSAAKLHAEIEKRREKDGAFLSALIAAGFHNHTGNQLDAMVRDGSATKLVTDARAASHAYYAALDELDARRRYHGGDKPIKRKIIY